MAAIYQRKMTWWVRFYHPRTRTLVWENLGTHDAAKAELARERIELETTLLEPRFQATDIPAAIPAVIGIAERAGVEDTGRPSAPVVSSGPPQHPSVAVQRQSLDRALQMYLAHIRSDNAVLHVENKISILHRFPGDERVASLLSSRVS